MPLPAALGRFNRRITNPFVRTFAGRVPGLGIVVHQGRSSGRTYRTPVSAFARPDGGFTLALFYGPDSQWVRNVVARGGCTLETSGRSVQLTNPRVVQDPSRRPVPVPVRVALGLLRVDHFMLLDPAGRRSA
jgi:deazaflavin-dependent oxidoreductase (nitroreductase family)